MEPKGYQPEDYNTQETRLPVFRFSITVGSGHIMGIQKAAPKWKNVISYWASKMGSIMMEAPVVFLWIQESRIEGEQKRLGES